MYAAVATVSISDYEKVRRVLHDDVLPTVTDIPGFVSGHWFAPVDGKGMEIRDLRDRERTALDGGADAARPPGERVRDRGLRRRPRSGGQRASARRRSRSR